jgi:hypothetical protein
MKFLAFILLIMLGSLLGGVYGIIHDQLTYTIAPEYYTKFKFVQFGLYEAGVAPPNARIAVSIVGFLATWWMGLFIGFILSLVGFIHNGWKSMVKITSKAFLLTMIIAFTTGLIGLLYGYAILSDMPAELRNWYIPEGVLNLSDYIAVGSMHNFSYLGGIIGLTGGIIYSLSRKPKLSDSIFWFVRKKTND